MKKYRELLKNIYFLTISNFGSKILIFLLVPLYTKQLSTQEYGNYDFIYVTISLLIPLLTLNIFDGATRFLLDKESKFEEKEIICKVTFKYLIISVLIIFVFCTINYFFPLIEILKDYAVFFFLLYFSTASYQAMQNIIRGFDKIYGIAIAGAINSILMVVFNILFLLVFKIGLTGFFIANILANFIVCLYLIFILKNDIKRIIFTKINKKIEKEMLKFSKPLMVNSIGWWINNVSDRYIVTYFCGAAINGIYSIAYKIPSILSVVQSIFNQAWTIFAIKNVDEENNDSIIKVYEIYNVLLITTCSSLILTSKILSKIFYMNEFFNAWIYMPFLLISMVFNSLSGTVGGVLSANKESKIMGTSTLLGAILNTLLNFILVKKIGALGAAISTMVSCLIVWLLRIFILNKRFKIMLVKYKDVIVYILMLIQSIFILLIKNEFKMYSLELTIFLLIIILNVNTIKKIIYKIFKREVVI